MTYLRKTLCVIAIILSIIGIITLPNRELNFFETIGQLLFLVMVLIFSVIFLCNLFKY